MSDAKTSGLLFWKGLFATLYDLEGSDSILLDVYVSGVKEIEDAPTVDIINFTLSFG